MGFWPFGGGKKQRADQATKHAHDQSIQGDSSENMARIEKAGTDLSGDTGGSTNRQRQEGKIQRLSKSRTSSQQQQQQQPSQITALPAPNSRRVSQNAQAFSEKQLYQHNPTSRSSLGPDSFNVVPQPPTLHARRSEQDSAFARRRSSKRKAEDYAREREIRAMTSSPIPIPKRPTSFYGSGPLQRDTRDIPGALNRKLHRPTSQVSLPLPEALPIPHDESHQHAFKIGMLAALSPRPTIKYDATPKHARGKQPQRLAPVSRPPILEEETDADKRRIDDLADDLDAGGLRELLERDRKRKERKKQAENARLQRRLERRAEHDREEEARKARTEEYVSASASRVSGLGIESPGQQEHHDDQSYPGPSRNRQEPLADPFADSGAQPSSPAIRNPFEDEKDMDVLEEETLGLGSEPVIPVRSPLRQIRTDMVNSGPKPLHGTLSPPTSPITRGADRQSTSQGSLLHREITIEIPESESITGGASDHSSQKLSSWTAFFRRGTRRKLSSSFQGRSTPSEFSNTSRESFTRKQPPVMPQRTFRRVDAATPQRTMSKFREDLPELPISPPDSRIQSPEAVIPPAAANFSSAVTQVEPRAPTVGVAAQTPSIPSSPIPVGIIGQENTPSIPVNIPPGAKQEVILSQSLASVDSEASWLSGKPLHRPSGASRRLQGSRSSLTPPLPGVLDGANDQSSPAESPAQPENGTEADESTKKDETWHVGVARHPTVIRQAVKEKSKEGLLNDYVAKEDESSPTDSDDEDVEEQETPGNEEAEPEVTLMRAKSVEYKTKHARHISAGSAKLLDIRRSSVHSQDLLLRQSSISSQDQLKEAPAAPTS